MVSMVSILNEKINKVINDDEPHFRLKTRKYGSYKTAAVPFPEMELTKAIGTGSPVKVWIEKIDQKIVMLVVLDGKEE